MLGFAVMNRSAFAAGALVVLALSCATRQDVVVSKLRGRGTPHVYSVTPDQAWAISKTILSFEHTETVDEHRQDGYMLTSEDTGSLSPGTYMGVFVEPDGARSAKVTFIARRRSALQAYSALDDNTFHKRFADLLGLIATVGPLPAAPPSPEGGGPTLLDSMSADAGPSALPPKATAGSPEGGL